MVTGTCYNHEVLRFERPLFKRIPRSFLITMSTSSRRDSYIAQLHKYPPTAEVIVVTNAGYRKCEKPAWVRTPASDLWDANLHVAACAMRQGTEPVLILEDDFLFTDRFPVHAESMEEFICKESNTPIAYKLGCLPILVSPVPDPPGHLRVFIDADTHAVIYNRAALEVFDSVTTTMKNSLYPFHDAVLYRHLTVYAAHEPCAIQTKDFNTENAQAWNWSRVPELVFHCLGGTSQDYYRNAHACYGGVLPWIASLLVVSIFFINKSLQLTFSTLETNEFKSRNHV